MSLKKRPATLTKACKPHQSQMFVKRSICSCAHMQTSQDSLGFLRCLLYGSTLCKAAPRKAECSLSRSVPVITNLTDDCFPATLASEMSKKSSYFTNCTPDVSVPFARMTRACKPKMMHLSRPGVEPVQGGAIHQSRKLTGSYAKFLTHRAEAQDDMQICPHLHAYIKPYQVVQIYWKMETQGCRVYARFMGNLPFPDVALAPPIRIVVSKVGKMSRSRF